MNSQEPRPQVIRAWIDTLFIPMLEGLESTIRFLDKENWTWRHHPEHFEHLRPATGFIEEKGKFNLRHFSEENAGSSILTLVEKQREGLNRLGEQCSKEYALLSRSSPLSDRINALLQTLDLSQNTRIATSFGEKTNVHDREYLLEYLLNNMGDLPTYYVLSRFWSEHREELFSVIASIPDLQETKEETKAIGLQVKGVSRELSSEIWNQVKDWSNDHDIPVVASAA